VSTPEGSHARWRIGQAVELLTRTQRGPQRPLQALEDVRHAQATLADVLDLLTLAARSEGATGGQIARSLGISRQAVHQAEQRRRAHQLERQEATVWRVPMPPRRRRIRLMGRRNRARSRHRV
jgi:hypothetical protein